LIFAIAARDELWAGGRRLESRLMHGIARQNGSEITAIDDADDALVAACEQAMNVARPLAQSIDARVRVVVRVTADEVETTFTVTIGGVSIVSTPQHVEADTNYLRDTLGQPSTVNRQLPTVWHNGSASVLLHEAIGHADEHNAPPVAWPEWLRVEAPLTMRRESFSDVPLLRMTHLRTWQESAPFALPEERVDVRLVAGGAYDPLTDVVTVHVAVPRFTIRATRAEIARALRGASGEPLRYPGVICSREGQELHVPGAAPLMVTDPL
jgi:hypothetical protein